MFQTSYRFIEEEMVKKRMVSSTFNPIESYIEVMFKWLETKPAYASYLCHYYYLSTSKIELAVNNHVFLKQAYLRIESYLHESVGRELFAKPKNMSFAVRQIHSLLMGCCLIASIGRTKQGLETQKEICLDTVRQLLKSL
jgi:hypothetical protein